jgi:hypothetical protein
MRKSYRVLLSKDIKFNNDRDPHVETPEEYLTGKTFPIGNRREKNMRGNTVVMYDVIGVSNGKYPAHLTVYFGPNEGASEY